MQPHDKLQTLLQQTPEEEELDRKLVEFAELEGELAQRELDLATLQAELHTFQWRYFETLGGRFALLDEINAQIAELRFRLNPSDPRTQEEARRSREQARQSAQGPGLASHQDKPKFRPSADLKKLYREVAKRIHPDLAVGEDERRRRQLLMAEANHAYEELEEVKLQAILYEWQSSPESVKGEGIGAELVRVIRKISQIKARLMVIRSNTKEVTKSQLYELKGKVEEADKREMDLLKEMGRDIDQRIDLARRHLEILSAQESKKRV